MPDSPALRQARTEPHVIEPEHRPRLALLCAAALFAVLAVGFLGLHRADVPLPAIARYAMEIALPQWKITEPVNEIVYGTRGFDTFGETFLLMAAIVSVATIARSREPRGEYLGEEEAGLEEQRESDPSGSGGGSGGGSSESGEESEAREAEQEEEGQGEIGGDVVSGDAADRTPLGARAPEHSRSMTVVVQVAARAAAVILGVAAVYLCARGYSPGGGFPAGAALSGVALLLYAALGYRAVSKVVRPTLLEPVEMVGALAVVALAVLGLVLRGSVMANWIPLAPARTIFSGGLLQAFSVTELVEVATGLTIAVFAVLSMKHDWTPDTSDSDTQESDTEESGTEESETEESDTERSEGRDAR